MPNCVRARVVVATGGLGIKPAAAPASGAPHPPFFDGVVLTPRGSSSLVALRLGLAGGTDFDLPLPLAMAMQSSASAQPLRLRMRWEQKGRGKQSGFA